MRRVIYIFLALSQLLCQGVVGRILEETLSQRNENIRSRPVSRNLRENRKVDSQQTSNVVEMFQGSTTSANSNIGSTSLLSGDIKGTRDLTTSEESCLPFGTSCDSSSSNCCQGGCSTSEKCFCQANNGMCFNFGKRDNFCCSNRCGTDGRCQCISEGNSCLAGDFCCNGSTCGAGGLCVSKSFETSEPTHRADTEPPTHEPTDKPTQKPVSLPTVSEVLQSEFVNNCQANGGLCFNAGGEDIFCCSNFCGSKGRCQCVPTGKSCANGDYCCNGLTCSANGRCISEYSPNTINPTSHPTTLPTNLPTKIPTSKPTQYPTLRPTRRPTPEPTSNPIPMESRISDTTCSTGDIKITVEILTDIYGGDTSWFIAKSNRIHRPIINVVNGTYSDTSYDKRDICVQPGTYNFTVYDEYGDGICCAYGDGYVKIYLDDREIMHIKSFGKMETEILNVGFDPTTNMTTRDFLYLEAHNVRRQNWHESNNVSYVPLLWSPELAEESRIWAEELLVNCSSSGIEHEHGVQEGENLAKNVGKITETGGWGQLYPPNNIVGRWVDWEVKRPYPGNAHLTQALWRPSKYMGCGESHKPFRGGECRVQVCRYARAGNCDMARYNSTFGKNWLPPMLADSSRCGPSCPPEGCY